MCYFFTVTKIVKEGLNLKRVITYGTYDLLHYGHIELLRRAREMGDYLIVALSTDEFNRIKNKKSYYNYEQRKMMLESIRYVDLVIPEDDWGQKERDVERYDVDTFVMGHDWEGEFDFLKDKCEVIYLKRTEGISTTQIKKELYGKDAR
ncbi:glycerol-3-phosphate cytidylyltransferase [Staphylococcus simulans]|nr:glycerol-3-phosphate cytidylyltransferase [Staphylococcus simulans]